MLNNDQISALRLLLSEFAGKLNDSELENSVAGGSGIVDKIASFVMACGIFMAGAKTYEKFPEQTSEVLEHAKREMDRGIKKFKGYLS
jgi:hypothetical protein